ncbi:MAG: hypothetical protein NZ772_08480 [Cyanobacteria bacterium]|nr:hypothetical protein [Cyanobacteriota bacterium]MDW8201513.1 hypothetical protein [Cyanobacteriota bacterium SKYGB_h_bin112]
MSASISNPASSAVLASKASATATAASSSRSSATTEDQLRSAQLPPSIYSIDHQVKYLHLQAETDALLQQLQLLQRARQA